MHAESFWIILLRGALCSEPLPREGSSPAVKCRAKRVQYFMLGAISYRRRPNERALLDATSSPSLETDAMSETSGGIEQMIALARREPEKLGDLLKRYEAYLSIWAKQRIGRNLEKECSESDLVQQTFSEACRAFPKFRGRTEPEFTAWLKRIHTHNLIDRIRKPSKPPHEPIYGTGADDGTASFCWREPATAQSTPSQRMIRGENALRLAELLQALPEAQGEAVRLRHIEGMPVQEISERLKRSVTATAGLIKRGLQKLREQMSESSWM